MFNHVSEIIYGFSIRKHGNMSPLRGDPADARENRIKFLSEFGISPQNTVKCRLSHSTNIQIVTHEQGGLGILPNTSPLPDTDGLITAEREVFLFMVTADCVPILLFDPQKSVVGLLHAGWKGTVQGIGAKGVWLMTENFGSSPKDIIALLGPSICKHCYEIGDEVKEQFDAAFPHHSHKIFHKPGDKFHLDLWKSNTLQLKEAGIPEENIENDVICTKCNVDKYYSARAEGIETGRFASVIGMRAGEYSEEMGGSSGISGVKWA
jgi:YfiH family protein